MEERELPVGWELAPLLDAGELIRGVTYSKKDASDLPFENSLPVLRANNIQIGSLRLEDLVHVPSGLVSEEQRIRAGDIVIATSSGSIAVVGKAAQAKRDLDAGFGAFCGLFRPSGDLCDGYLGHFFGTDYYRNSVSSMARGVNINNLKRSHFEELSVPLAPLNEQRRIASKLDTTLAAVESCRHRLEGVAALTKRFRQAVLEAANTGELTREWREEHETSDEWENAELGPLLDDMRYGTAKKCSYEATGSPVLRIPNILESGQVSSEDLKYADFDSSEIAKLSLRPGDLLVIRSNGSLDLVGRVAEASEQDAGMLFAGYLIRLRPDQEQILSPYLALCLRSPATRAIIELAARSTSGVNNINSQFLSGLLIPLPSIAEQHEIVRRAQQLFTLADQLEAKLTPARQVVERLTPALLTKAFRGELVPQDPSDEPASVLLERIRAARQAEAAAGKPSRRGRKKGAATPEPSLFEPAPVPPDLLATLLRECGALSEKALLAASELDLASFQAQLTHERSHDAIRFSDDDGRELLEAVD